MRGLRQEVQHRHLSTRREYVCITHSKNVDMERRRHLLNASSYATVLPELERGRFSLCCAVLDLSVQDMSLPLRVISVAICMYTTLNACSKHDAEWDVKINTSAREKTVKTNTKSPNIWKDIYTKCQKTGA